MPPPHVPAFPASGADGRAGEPRRPDYGAASVPACSRALLEQPELHEHLADLAQALLVVHRQPRPPRLAARLAEHLHDRLELALVAAVLAGPTTGQPQLREQLLRPLCVREARLV